MSKVLRRSSTVQKPDTALTASSYYSGTINTTSTQPLPTGQLSNSPMNAIENDKKPATELSKFTTDSSTNNHNNPDSGLSKQTSKSKLRRSLSLLSRKEEKQSQPLLKVHRYTIYDDEKGEFIEIIEEEWEGDGPPPKKSLSIQQQNTLMIDKDLPKLPEPIENTDEKKLFAKFNKWLKQRYPFILEFSKEHKRTLLISSVLFLLLIIVIIILARVL
ncbi:2314_t:CDS:1 [Acaulospora colombiana]|uniref:2314_t:CDS:1 n=1 Tax=Acaulospora colombiana TaxID=27376 RepID=A0ACA9KS71_9GLOM|nr:2314_t:CDS:1 [Acaulospora colombiana]